ncbi:ATP-dependent DNA ligase [Bacillus sp. FJAT-29937]|uniref:ATP-dependent DNA ligase n=1 Tax=Bacillus sp. FJAT-29937 TaxID=1720553 RepID=UPI0008361FDD|nr:RNA ligase family protein [Bacillus sp. FJAT-29937]
MKLNPIIPFEPVSSEEIPKGSEWISQIKWDGVRVLTYFDGQEVRLFNRKLNERTNIFPELTNVKSYTSAKSVILDGEVIALDKDGKPSFHEVMRRDGIRRTDRVKDVINLVPIYYMIFDVVLLNGEFVNNYSLMDRLNLLSEIIIPNEQIQIVPTQNDGHILFDVTKEHDLEGIICKNLNSQYIINGKNSDWKKIKNYKDLIAVVGGVTYRSEVVNSILIGLYDNEDQFWYIGNVGTGRLTGSEWKELTKAIEPLKIIDKPFINHPERLNKVQWLRPVLTVKVQYIEWPEGHSLRQPSIQAFVVHDPQKCKFED